MKKVIASAGLLALGAVGVQCARADLLAGTDKPWTISGTIRGFYDDNYNTVPDGPLRTGSWGFELRPSAGYKYNEGPNSLTLGYVYSLKDYTQRPGDTIDQAHEFDLTANHNFNDSFSTDIEESFVSSQEPEVLAGTGPASTPLRANGDNYHNTAGINFHAGLTKQLSLVLGYINSWYDWTGNPAGSTGPSYGTLLNDFVHTWSADLRWQVDEETVAIFEYRFAYTDYLSQGSLNPGAPRGTPATGTPGTIGFNPGYVAPDSRNNYDNFLDVGVEHSFRSDFGVNVHAGVEVTDYYNAQNIPGSANPHSLAPYANLSANYTYTDAGVLTLGFIQAKNSTDIAIDFQNGSLTQDEDSSTLYLNVVQVLKPISPDLTGTATFQYQHSVLNGGGFDNQSEDFYTVGFNLTYNITHFISTEFGYNYDLLDSGISNGVGAGRSYDRNRVYAGFTATY